MTRGTIEIAQGVIEALWHRSAAPIADFAANARFELQGRALEPEQFRQLAVTELQLALPDLRMRIRDTLVDTPAAGRDVVALRMSCTGTHAGVLFGVPASGESVSFGLSLWLRLHGPLIVVAQLFWNQFTAQEVLVAGRQRAAQASTAPGPQVRLQQ